MSKIEIIARLKELFASFLPRDVSVALFGSQARGDSSPRSDWDLLVLFRRSGRLSLADRGDIAFSLYKIGAELGIDINPVIYTEEEWQQRNFTPFYKNVVSDSVQLWG